MARERPPQKRKPRRTSRKTHLISAAPPSSTPEAPAERHHPHAAFPIVGIGSSAGGVEALEELFRHLPHDPKAAFVVVSHQHPTHSSLLPELLRRWTTLTVLEACDGVEIQPNTVYLPPPGTRLTIQRAVIYLKTTEHGERPFLPIDFAFRSLAEDQQENAVGIVLSGTGSDGALGLKAIKGESGMTMAQDPRSAKYAGMPKSAIAAGAVDFVLPPAELGAQLLNYLGYRVRAPQLPDLDVNEARDYQKLLRLLRDRTRNDFALYKDNTTRRRIERRMGVHQIATLSQYVRYLASEPAEAQALFEELLIGVTSFFRDPWAFEALVNRGLPQLLQGKPDGYHVRVWIPACSTGEEAYSIAMVVQEYLATYRRRDSLQVFASDIDLTAIQKARHGLYPEGIANDVTPERLKRWFVQEDSRYRVKRELRDCVIFAHHNVLTDPPFTKVDLLACRNFLIYLRRETQQWLLPLFYYALKPNGLLMLGNSESVDGITEFSPLDKRSRLFVRMPGPASPPMLARLSVPSAATDTPAPNRLATHRPSYLMEPIHALLLDRFAPAAVFVNRQGQIVYVHGRTGAYLEPAAGPASQNVGDMAREGLRPQLVAALQLAEKTRTAVVRNGLRVPFHNTVQTVTLTVTPLNEPEALKGLVLITFETASIAAAMPGGKTRAASVRPEEAALVVELQYTKERLQRTIEDLQLSNEEFRSANEELQSTNEELQSTNEEMETTREELQSLNEELLTVNAELQGKLDELAGTNDDLQNLINSTEVATVFLDDQLRIKRYTPEAARVSKVIASDIGRPFSDITSTVQYPELMEDAGAVLKTLVFKEREVQGSDGRWYLLRIFPYRTGKNVIAGLVLTYLNITESKRAAREAQKATQFAESIVNTIRHPLVVLTGDLLIVSANQAFYQSFNLSADAVQQQPLTQIAGGQLDQPGLRSLLKRLLGGDTVVVDESVEIEIPEVGKTRWMANARRIANPGDTDVRLLLALEAIPGPA